MPICWHQKNQFIIHYENGKWLDTKLIHNNRIQLWSKRSRMLFPKKGPVEYQPIQRKSNKMKNTNLWLNPHQYIPCVLLHCLVVYLQIHLVYDVQRFVPMAVCHIYRFSFGTYGNEEHGRKICVIFWGNIKINSESGNWTLNCFGILIL